MSIQDVHIMFDNIGKKFKDTGIRMDFVWHGGEPLAHEESYYRQIFDEQRNVFDQYNLTYTNSLQTNLTFLNDNWVAFFKEKLFSNIGVSFDPFGDQRVTRAGGSTQKLVLNNMQVLSDNDIKFGCISVLSAANIDRLDDCVSFYEEVAKSFRILPIYRTSYEGQHDSNSLDSSQILQAYILMFERWLQSDVAIQYKPIEDFIRIAVRHSAGSRFESRYYSKDGYDHVYIVNTNGDLYSNGDAYDERYCQGSLFDPAFSFSSGIPGRIRSCDESRARMSDACLNCPYFGSCSGFYMAESTPEQRVRDHKGVEVCAIVRPFIDYILARLEDLDFEEKLFDLLDQEDDANLSVGGIVA